jgi:hypothetical protein
MLIGKFEFGHFDFATSNSLTLTFDLFPCGQGIHLFADFHQTSRMNPLSSYGIRIVINDVIWPQAFYCPFSNPRFMQRLIVL